MTPLWKQRSRWICATLLRCDDKVWSVSSFLDTLHTFPAELTDLHQQILGLLGLSRDTYNETKS